MRRNYGSIKGAGFSRAFQEAALTVERDEPQPTTIHAAARPATVPACDRSGDIGSVHVYPPDAKHGDPCLCGKRRKVVLPADWPRL